jgi:hypothetical protein
MRGSPSPAFCCPLCGTDQYEQVTVTLPSGGQRLRRFFVAGVHVPARSMERREPGATVGGAEEQAPDGQVAISGAVWGRAIYPALAQRPFGLTSRRRRPLRTS